MHPEFAIYYIYYITERGKQERERGGWWRPWGRSRGESEAISMGVEEAHFCVLLLLLAMAATWRRWETQTPPMFIFRASQQTLCIHNWAPTTTSQPLRRVAQGPMVRSYPSPGYSLVWFKDTIIYKTNNKLLTKGLQLIPFWYFGILLYLFAFF